MLTNSIFDRPVSIFFFSSVKWVILGFARFCILQLYWFIVTSTSNILRCAAVDFDIRTHRQQQQWTLWGKYEIAGRTCKCMNNVWWCSYRIKKRESITNLFPHEVMSTAHRRRRSLNNKSLQFLLVCKLDNRYTLNEGKNI